MIKYLLKICKRFFFIPLSANVHVYFYFMTLLMFVKNHLKGNRFNDKFYSFTSSHNIPALITELIENISYKIIL